MRSRRRQSRNEDSSACRTFDQHDVAIHQAAVPYAHWKGAGRCGRRTNGSVDVTADGRRRSAPRGEPWLHHARTAWLLRREQARRPRRADRDRRPWLHAWRCPRAAAARRGGRRGVSDHRGRRRVNTAVHRNRSRDEHGRRRGHARRLSCRAIHSGWRVIDGGLDVIRSSGHNRTRDVHAANKRVGASNKHVDAPNKHVDAPNKHVGAPNKRC
jgi:hypothetical protein